MVKKITRKELRDLVSSGAKFRLVDVLDKDHYAKEHIKGAVSLPLQEVESRAEKLLKKDDLVVTYCASFECQASTKAAEKLMAMGFKNVLDYKGGLKDYKEANLPLEGQLHQATAEKESCVSCCSG
jgi:rhodanese-related sulfurtransferase